MKYSVGTWGTRNYPYPATSYVFDWAKKAGFNGIEVCDAWLNFYPMDDGDLKKVKEEFRKRELLAPAITVTSATLVGDEMLAKDTFRRIQKAIKVASVLGAEIVNLSLVQKVPPRTSFEAQPEHYEVLASNIAKLADEAANSDIKLSIEMHQGAIVDTSDAVIKAVKMINRPNVGVNPDLGNWYWAHPKPYEPWEDTLKKLSQYTIFWHVKNLLRIYVPNLDKAFFAEVALPFGDIDYRRAFLQIIQSGFDGFVGVETVTEGDPFILMSQGLEYLQNLEHEFKMGCR